MRPNNFDGLRLLGAAAVLWSHMYLLTGRAEPQTPLEGTYGHLGVLMFFSISGYLVALSWQRDPDAFRFLARRALRVIPGVAVALGLAYAAVALLGLNGFPRNPRPELNESLWTIPLEVYCYLILAGLLLAAGGAARWMEARAPRWHRARRVLRAGAWMALLMFGGVLAMRALDTYVALFSYGLFFAVGVLVAEYDLLRRPWVLAGFALLAAGFYVADHPYMVKVLLVPVTVIYIGTRSWPVLRSAGRYGDLSYGIYIYAWPVQQICVALLPGASFAVLLATSAIITTALAWLSWRLVEKPALAFKPGGAGWIAGNAAPAATGVTTPGTGGQATPGMR